MLLTKDSWKDKQKNNIETLDWLNLMRQEDSNEVNKNNDALNISIFS
jgi:hypothetical protein